MAEVTLGHWSKKEASTIRSPARWTVSTRSSPDWVLIKLRAVPDSR